MSENMTESVCPDCLKRIPAFRVVEGNDVYLEKRCPIHGEYRTLVWQGTPPIESWVNHKTPSHPQICYTEMKDGCPFDCGLCAEHRQHTCTALLEITQRCNLSCRICFADAGKGSADDPSLEVIDGWYRSVLKASGPCNIQLSGGEPTMRDDLPELVGMGRKLGFEFIQINTNGLRLAKEKAYVRDLARAGLASVFLQFDGTEDYIYERLRGRKLLAEKKAAIRHCAEHNIGVILVPTLVPSVNTENIGSMIRFAMDNMPAVRGVHFQPVSYFGRYSEAAASMERITIPEVLRLIERQMEGLVRASDFSPPGCEHALCSFHGNFIRREDGALQASGKKKSACCSTPEPAAEGARKAKQFVATHWAAPTDRLAGSDSSDATLKEWNQILQGIQENYLAISGMAFQDAWTLDLERLKSCCIHVVAPNGKLVPFCAYNLTDSQGTALYRGKSEY